MSIRRSAALRFLYALPIVWLGVRLPVAIDHAEALLHPHLVAPDRRLPVPVRKTAAVSQPAFPPPSARPAIAVRSARRGRSVAIPIEIPTAHLISAVVTQLDPPAPAAYIPDRAWQLADAAYAELRRGRRREAAALLREADKAAPNDGWRRDFASLTSRWHGDAWLLARNGGGNAPLGVNAPALGRSQLGARIDYLPDPLGRRPLIVETRLARPFRGGATQLAVGVGIRPLPALPLRITAERQIATGGGTRDAWSLRGEGGVSAMALFGDFNLDAYGEAGVVGVRSSDLFVDGDARITRRLHPAISAGAAMWAAAQPGAQRIDMGPAIVGRLRQGHANISVSIDYRLRVAGNARPGNGPALTIAAGF